jgi:hypothetical protein
LNKGLTNDHPRKYAFIALQTMFASVRRVALVYRDHIAMILEGEKQVRVRAGGKNHADP